MKLRIAFATLFDSEDVMRGSGTFYHLQRALGEAGHEVHLYGPYHCHESFLSRAIRKTTRFLGGRYKTYMDPFVGINNARALDREIADSEFDLLITSDYGLAAFTREAQAIVLYTDAMIPAKYQRLEPPPDSGVQDLRLPGRLFLQFTIRRALSRARLVVFPAQWQVDEALAYGADAGRVRVIPFGANVVDPVTPGSQIEKNHIERTSCRMLFVGKDWLRKGGDIAVETLLELRSRGINASLDVVGPPERPAQTVDGLHWHGALRKSDPGELERLDRLFRLSHVLVVPSIFEGFGIVFAEAAAYGVPSLAIDAYGVKGAVSSGRSGVLLPPGSSPQAFADVIHRWIDQPEQYNGLCVGAREFYETDVNWAVAVKRLIFAVESVL